MESPDPAKENLFHTTMKHNVILMMMSMTKLIKKIFLTHQISKITPISKHFFMDGLNGLFPCKSFRFLLSFWMNCVTGRHSWKNVSDNIA